MKVLITGGAGYIGNEMVYRLSANPAVTDILVYDNLFKQNYNLFTGLRKVPNANVKFVQADILDTRSLRTHMEDADVVYHLAARVRTPYTDQRSHDFEQTNHWGTAELVYTAEEVKPSRVIFVSSYDVYGQGHIQSVDDPREPSSYYGISKMRGEDHMIRLMEKMPVYVVRCADVYGYSKNLRFETAINQAMFDAHFTNRITVHGDPSQQNTYIHLDHLVDVLQQLVTTEQSPGIYNLGYRVLSTTDVIEGLRELYPALETIFVDQHVPPRNLVVERDERLAPLESPNPAFVDNLRAFSEMFTF